MNIQEFRNLIKNSLNIDSKMLDKISVYGFEEIISSLSEKEKLTILGDRDLLNSIGLTDLDIFSVVQSFSSETKFKIINNEELCKSLGLSDFYWKRIISSLNSDQIEVLLKEKTRISSLIEGENNIAEIIAKVSGDEKKIKLAEDYGIGRYNIGSIIISCSDNLKEEFLISDKYDLSNYTKENILASFDLNKFLEFFDKNQDYFKENGIRFFKVIKKMEPQKQEEFINEINNIPVSIEDKRKALVVISKDVKEKIDKNKLDEKFKEALEITYNSESYYKNYIEVDYNGDLEKYKGLDELIYINPTNIPVKDHEKMLELAKICPNLNVEDEIDLIPSTGKEFVEGEEWVRNVLANIR